MKAVLLTWRVVVTALLVGTFVVAAEERGSARGAADKDVKLSGCLIRGEGDGAGYLLANPPTEPWLNSPDKQVAPSALGTSGDYAPFSSRNADGTFAGFDVEVARAYAADRGREVVFVPFRWPELATRLAAGDFDVVMSGVTVRPDRLVGGIFTAPVARSDAILAVASSAAPAGSAEAAARSFDRPFVGRA